jgi:hypothetical protein
MWNASPSSTSEEPSNGLSFDVQNCHLEVDKRSGSLLLGDEKSSLFETATGAAQHVFLIDTK